MKISDVGRNSHVGKNIKEKEAYRRFLASKFELDKTESDPINTDKTNESSYDEDEPPQILKIQKKSTKLVIGDFINNHWVVAIVSGIIVITIIGLFSFFIDIKTSQAVYCEKINNLEKVNDDNKKGISVLKENFDIFKTEVTKDLEYIKKKFN